MSDASGVPIGWTSAPLGDLGIYINGRGFGKAEWSKTGRPIIRIQDLTGTRGEPNYFDGQVEEKYLVQPGDLLVSWAATLGAFIWKGPEGWLNQHIFRVESHIEKSFHYYLIQAILDDLKRKMHGGGIVHITKGKFDDTSVLLPPIGEQRRLVSKIEEIFSDLDASVAALERARANLKRYRAAVLKAAVEGRLTAQWRKTHPAAEPASKLLERILAERRKKWEKAQLAKFAAAGKAPPKDWKDKYPEPAQPDATNLPDLPEGWCWASIEQLVVGNDPYALAIGPFGSNLKVGDYRDEGVPLIFVRNIRAKSFGQEGARYVSFEKAKELRAHSVKGGDLLVTKMGDPPGDACLYPIDQPAAIITADCIKARLSDFLKSHRYIELVINSEIAKKQIASMTRGVAQQKVSLQRFRPLAIPIPPMNELEAIIEQVDVHFSSLDVMEHAAEVSLLRASRLRQSILKRAFEGKLVPQDPNDEPASVLLERIRAALLVANQKSKSQRKTRARKRG